jgi:hypothetical protein
MLRGPVAIRPGENGTFETLACRIHIPAVQPDTEQNGDGEEEDTKDDDSD